MERRIFLIPVLAAAAFAQQQQPAQQIPATQPDPTAKPATLEGRVIHSITGEPLRKVALSLRPSTRNTGANATSISTDADGRFRFENLQAGSYLLSGDKTGFIRQMYSTRRSTATAFNGTPIELRPGQSVSTIEFKMTPQGVITGKVLDEDGEPVARAGVSAIRIGTASRGGGGGGGGDGGTNDVGEFRLSNLAAGKYRIVVQRGGGFLRGGQAGRGPLAGAAPPTNVESYVPTFYPGVIDESQAALVTVAPGQEVGGINIQFQKSAVFHVRGRIAGLTPIPGDDRMRPRLMLQPVGRRSVRGPGMGSGMGSGVKPDGTFDIAQVTPGAYELTLMQFDRGRGGVIGRTPVTVGQSDVDDVTLQVLGLVDITGVVRVDGDDKYKATGTVRLTSVTSGPGGGGFRGGGPGGANADTNGKIADGNAFSLAGLSRDRFIPQLQPMPAGMYVKSVRVSGQDVPDFAVDLSSSPALIPIELVLSAKAAAIDGTVMDGDKPVDSAGVVALPDPLDPNLMLVRGKTASTSADGKFTLEGLAPGDYKIYAFDEAVSLQSLDLESLKLVDSAAVTVKLRESARETAKLDIARLK